MNIFSTFINIAKKETIHRSSIRSLIREMRDDVVEYKNEYQSEESPAVPSDFPEEAFCRAYRTLQWTSMISLGFVLGLIAYAFILDDWVATISSLAFSFIAVLWHTSFVMRGYRSRYVYEHWDKKDNPFIMDYSELFDAVIESPKILFPILCPLPERPINGKIKKSKKRSSRK